MKTGNAKQKVGGRKPKSPLPAQTQERPGIESKIEPRPQYLAPDHKGADTPMKRPAQPEEVAPAFVFFASNADSSYITGEVLTLLG